MGLLDYIERLRRRSERERMGVAFGLSAGITGLIALMWLGTIFVRSDSTLEPQTAASVESFTSELDSLKEELNASYEAVRSGVNQFSSGVSEESATEEPTLEELFGDDKAF